MDKKKKTTIIIVSIVLALLLIGGVAFFAVKYFKKPVETPKPVKVEKVTITFDADGGSEVESIELDKGSKTELPTSEKEGYIFDGWYLEEEKLDAEYVYDKDVTLKAKWEKEKEETTTFIVKFDSNGGSKVSNVTLKCGDAIKLPKTPTKDGYTFVAWADNGGRVLKNGEKLECKNVTYTAYWDKKETKTETKTEPKTDPVVKEYTVTFDSNGGTPVASIKYKEGEALKLPGNPTKDGYTFVSWSDTHGKVILDGALLTGDITLYANWDKNKTYTCPAHYTLSGTECTIRAIAKTRCPEGTNEYDGKCYTITYDARKNPVKTCGTKIINTGGGHTPSVKGELFQMGTYYCYYGVVSDPYEQQNSNNCTTRGHKWNSQNNKCYYDSDGANVNITNSCSDSDYEYVANPATIRPGATLNGGCYPVRSKEKYCPNGSLSGNMCRISIPATLE